MRRDLAAVLVTLLGTGGWVCSSSEPCSGQLTCDTDVADVCCPPGSPYYCDGACSVTACAVRCRYRDETDDGPCPIALLSATIDSASCTAGAGAYIVNASGTAMGCGSGAILVGASTATTFATSTVECGSWSPRGATCTPDSSSATSTTTWKMTGAFTTSSSGSFAAKISVSLEGIRDAALATHSVDCE